MSFLARIAMRAGLPGEGAAELPLLVPKNRGLQRPPHLTGQQGAPAQEGAPMLRRQLEPDSEEEEVATLRRQPAIHGGAIEAAGQAPIVGSAAAEEQVAPPAGPGATSTPEAEETEPARPIAHIPAQRIARMPAPPIEQEEDTDEDAEAAGPLRRSLVVRRAVRDAPAPAPEGPGQEIPAASASVAEQPESSNRGASRAALLPSEPPVSIPGVDRPEGPSWRSAAITALPPPRPVEMLSEAATARSERPQVVIDQLDVLIHEPAPPVRGPDLAKRRSRSLRARYLGRL